MAKQMQADAGAGRLDFLFDVPPALGPQAQSRIGRLRHEFHRHATILAAASRVAGGGSSTGGVELSALADKSPTSFPELASIDEDVNPPGDGDGVIPVAKVMCRDEEDPGMQAARKMDWECFVASRDGGDQALLQCLGEGWTTAESSHRLHISALTIRTRLTQLRQSLLEFFGEAMMSEAIRKPQWFHDLRVAKEHFACRSERGRQMQ